MTGQEQTRRIERAVVLDRIEPGWTPPYCVHGRATCVGGCGEWVYLGDQTVKVVHSGEAAPVCRQCADRHRTPDTRPVGRVEDHQRKDGPHA